MFYQEIDISKQYVNTCVIFDIYTLCERSSNYKTKGIEDVTVIGGGVAGTYAAYRLRNKNLNIGLYEMSDRIGGRYFTQTLKKIPDVNIELGAMRYKPKDHVRLDNLIKELRLPIDDFELKQGIPSQTRYYLRGQQIPFPELGKPGFLPYNVKPSERLDRDNLKYKIFKENTNTTDNSEPLYTLATNDDQPLYKQSFQQVVSKSASNEAYLYLKDSNAFHEDIDDAIGVFIRKDKPIQKPFPDFGLPDVKTVVSGFSSIAETMAKKFLHESKSHSLYMNHRLVEIKPIYGGRIKLTFRKTVTRNGVTTDTKITKTVISKNVILCIPKEPLMRIRWKAVQNAMFKREVLDSSRPVLASKIFLGYPFEWWKAIRANFSHAITDLTIRQTYDWKVSKTSGRAVLLASYTDESGTVFWDRVRGQGKVVGGRRYITDVTDEVIKHVHLSLAELYQVDVRKIPYPIDGAMFIFNSYPFNGAWYNWVPGYKIEEVRFSMVKPSCSDNIFIASGSYTSHRLRGWSEGSLEAVDEVLNLFSKRGSDEEIKRRYPCRNF
ncbi:hypothetical protein KUTeg_024473 [Tegillarca granosa]|uniref:Amine oxidase domain-containing protein n=1 Tax=Tegillarca granosa TaxID=220873 RepID=A0ABQ9E2Y5_TEGGR|nr:hypothetical protein KUTeg_024473 [Tegillarca granosa]